MPQEYYPADYYPRYSAGAAYMQSGNITHKLLKAVDEYSGYVLDIDDMFITGMMAEKAGVERHKTNLIAWMGCENVSVIEERIVTFQCKDQGQIQQFWSDFKGNAPSNEFCPLNGGVSYGYYKIHPFYYLTIVWILFSVLRIY